MTSGNEKLRWIIRKICSVLVNRFRLVQYRRYFVAERFDIDWRAIHYNRISVVNLLAASKPECQYLEIGCAGNDLFDSVIALHKTGVDPESGGTHRLTSDDFFKQNPHRMFDIIFIDGLHTYEQVRRDIIHSLAHLSPGGWIALHDMFPRNWLEECVPWIMKNEGKWTGDVWKVAFDLAESKDIEFKILKLDHGVGVLRPLNPHAKIPDMHNELESKRFSYFYENIHRLPIVDYELGRKWMMANI